MKKLKPLFAAFAALGGLLTAPALASKPGDAWLITPGKGIGKMALGPNGTEVLKTFPEPDIPDFTLGQTTQIWFGRKNRNTTLSIHTVSNGAIDAKPGSGDTIKTVRTSSGRFHTASGISVGSTLARIQDVFPQMRRDQERKDSVIYADARRGIAFEFASDKATARCVAISVFTPGDSYILDAEYVSMLIRDHLPVRGRR